MKGITQKGKDVYEVRVRVVDRRTGRLRAARRVLRGVTKRQAMLAREELRRELQDESVARPTRVKFGDFAASWLKARRAWLKPSTAEKYAYALDLQIAPAFGEWFIDGIRQRDIEEWMANLSQRYRPETVNGVFSVLRTILRDAVAELSLPDPTARVKPLPRRTLEDRRVWLTGDELGCLLDAARGDEDHALVLTLALTGWRWGEVTALRWEDVNETDGVLWLRRAHVRGLVGTPKTHRERMAPLVPVLAAVLRDHRQRLLLEQHPGLAAGWVFATRSDADPRRASLRTPSSLNKKLRRWATAAGIGKRITPHVFRRTAVNLLREAAVDAVVAKSIVGHSTEAMRERYSRVAADEQRAAVGRVLDLIRRESES